MNSAKNKGAGGEREIANMLNAIVRKCYEVDGRHGADIDNPELYIQRNQIQSAIGGKDLINTFGLAIEVKRQEALAINTWWKQTEASADRLKEKPVLIYRQNRRSWRVVMQSVLPNYKGTTDHGMNPARIEISIEDFLSWFEMWITLHLYHSELD